MQCAMSLIDANGDGAEVGLQRLRHMFSGPVFILSTFAEFHAMAPIPVPPVDLAADTVTQMPSPQCSRRLTALLVWFSAKGGTRRQDSSLCPSLKRLNQIGL